MNHYAIYLALLNSTSSWHRYMHLVTTVIPNFERKTDRFRGTVQASSCYTALGTKMFGVTAANFTSEMVVFIRA